MNKKKYIIQAETTDDRKLEIELSAHNIFDVFCVFKLWVSELGYYIDFEKIQIQELR